jgi:phosphocarrier protein
LIEEAMTLETRKPNGQSNGQKNGQQNGQGNGQVITGSVRLVHAAGMHARPAVKLTKLAKKFQAQISIRASHAAEWINAKSVAKVMALRAARDSIIEIEASGEDAEGAVAALVDLVATDFPDTSP